MYAIIIIVTAVVVVIIEVVNMVILILTSIIIVPITIVVVVVINTKLTIVYTCATGYANLWFLRRWLYEFVEDVMVFFYTEQYMTWHLTLNILIELNELIHY